MSETKTKPSDLKLLDRNEVTNLLAPTENLNFIDLKPGDDVEVHFHGTKDESIINIGEAELRINPQALIDTAHCIGMPKKYVGKCPSDLLFPHLNYWFGEGMSTPVRVITREGVVVSMTADRVKTAVVSNERLLQIAEEKLGNEHIVGYHQIHTDLDLSTISVVTDQTFEPVKEDTLFGGIKIQNSILGKDVVEVSPYIFRQWCSNGAITSQSLGRYTRKKHDNLNNWFGEIIEGSSSELEKEFERIRHLTQVSVKGHVPETIQGIAKDRRISQKITEEILERASSEKVETMYDLWNCITWVASHNVELTPLAATRLQWTAGVISKEHEICETCHRILG